MNYIERKLQIDISASIERSPVTVLLGPRQSGKTTLVKKLLTDLPKSAHYLDLELPSDARKLADPELYFKQFEQQTIVVDEVQRMPALFPILRALVDQNRIAGRFILLGSASPDLLLKSAESLAGRVEYHYLTPFLLNEINAENQQKLWFRGGFPNSFLAKSDADAQYWLENFTQTYVERDLPMLGMGATPILSLNLLRMIVSAPGQLLNINSLASALGISAATANKYLDILEHAFLIRRLLPFPTKIAKRIVKSPKLFLRDTGILHALAEINSVEKLVGNMILGSSWESFSVEQIISTVGNKFTPYFYRTADDSEIDLILAKGIEPIFTIEIKYSNTPNLSKNYWVAIENLAAKHNFIVTPSADNYKIQQGVEIISLSDLMGKILSL